MKKDFNANMNKISVYVTPGNKLGDNMVGGEDVKAINKMLKDSFSAGIAGKGEAVIKIGNYKGRNIFEQKAADQIRISLDEDGNAYVKLIIRQLDPGLGLVALAGGFKDAGETDKETADREENEEAKSDKGYLIITHKINRHPVTGDVRIWVGEDRDDGVKNGDIIAMSTVGIIPVVKDAHKQVEAGDDASHAGWVKLSKIKDSAVFGIKDHAEMLLKAVSLAGLDDQLPSSFLRTLKSRNKDILVGSKPLQAKARNLIEPPKSSVISPSNKPIN